MKLVNDHGLFASRPRDVRKRLPGGRSALCQSGDWLGIKYVLGFGASALFTAHGRVLDLWGETSHLYSCTEFTNPLALRRRWRS